ncbi:MAG: dihydroorotase [Bacteroidota bacterium]
MANKILIKDVRIVNEGNISHGSVAIVDEKIDRVFHQTSPQTEIYDQIIEGENRLLVPGVIDDQVHFREPGLTHKADIYSESKAAVAGGITSFMEMPNTKPQAITQKLLEDKYQLAHEKSLANYSFYMGVTNNNASEVMKTNPQNTCGIKIFMGSSTGNMLVDDRDTLNTLFRESPLLIATHCEDEATIRENTNIIRQKYGEKPPFSVHPLIRSEEACYRSSSLAADLAAKHNSRLHILHISTARELSLFRNDIPSSEKQITSEACIHHLWFDDSKYPDLEWRIKWNPAVKTAEDREALLEAVNNNTIDVIATDHAPHTLEEKQNNYWNSPSGGPMVQHALAVMLDLHHQGKISLPQIINKMCHQPAEIFQIEKRGFIREGYYADIVLVDDKQQTVSKDNLHYKCGWSPIEGETLHNRIYMTMINGHVAFKEGKFFEDTKGKRLKFKRQ